MDRVDDHASGEWLRRERTRRRLTLAQAAQATRIRERFLLAIENDDADALPNPVFTIGLIRNYARFLGLDPEPFVRAYKARIGSTPVPEVRPEATRGAYVHSRAPSFLAPAVFAILLVALAGYLYQQVATYVSSAGLGAAPHGTSIALSIPTPLPSPAPARSPTLIAMAQLPTSVATARPTARPRVSPTPEPSPTPRSTATPVPTATPTGIRIDAVASGRVWMEVKSDGKIVFAGILMPGDKRTWTGTQSVMLWSGNAGYVDITYNGKPLGALGPAGQVLKKTWSANA